MIVSHAISVTGHRPQDELCITRAVDGLPLRDTRALPQPGGGMVFYQTDHTDDTTIVLDLDYIEVERFTRWLVLHLPEMQ